MLIAIPSKGRPYKSKSMDFLGGGAIMFAPQCEVKDYEKIYPGKIIGVPDDVRGITPTRNWILKQHLGEDVVFVDDDLKVCKYLKYYGNCVLKHTKLTGEQVKAEFEKLFELTKSLGWKIWGVNTESSKISTRINKPFIFRSYITASCMGIVNDGTLFFDESYKVKEDYEIGLRHVVKYGGVLKARYFYWENEHWTTDGGCKEYRTNAVEDECIRKLIKQYPGMVRRVSRKNSAYCIKLMFDD